MAPARQKCPNSTTYLRKTPQGARFRADSETAILCSEKNNCHNLLNNKKNTHVKGLGTPLAKTKYHNDEWFGVNRKHHHGLRFILPVMTQYPPGNRKRVNHEQTAPNLIQESR
jgi:hypothetical protein